MPLHTELLSTVVQTSPTYCFLPLSEGKISRKMVGKMSAALMKAKRWLLAGVDNISEEDEEGIVDFFVPLTS